MKLSASQKSTFLFTGRKEGLSNVSKTAKENYFAIAGTQLEQPQMYLPVFFQKYFFK